MSSRSLRDNDEDIRLGVVRPSMKDNVLVNKARPRRSAVRALRARS